MQGTTNRSTAQVGTAAETVRWRIAEAAGTARLSLLPAFQDRETGETHLSVDAQGRPASVHLIDGLDRKSVV